VKITRDARCPSCGSTRVRHHGHDAGSDEDLYECLDCGQMADKADF
jgi:DNA-directed RNA polymerase subunit RPC12/RpoP